MQKKTLEVVIYDIKPEFIAEYRTLHLPKFRELVSSFEGMISYQTLASCNQEGKHIDLVEWQDLASAVKAAEMVKVMQQSDEFKGYLEAFDNVSFFHHFSGYSNT